MNVVVQRYARALADSLPAERSEVGLDQLRHLSDILAREPGARQLLTNPAVSPDARQTFIGRLSGMLQLEPAVRNLLSMLVDRRRLGILEDLCASFEKLVDDRNGTLRVQVISAEEMPQVDLNRLAQRLGHSTGKRIVLSVDTDRSILGGIVVRIGGTVIDASVRQRLAGLQRELRAY